LAQVAAVASLGAEDQLRARVADLVAERARVVSNLRANGYKPPDTQANFVWLPLGEGSMRFTADCEAAGVMVRPFHPEGVRITVATAEIDDRFLAVATRPR
jgi:histidinol-phosphate aminotransferase